MSNDCNPICAACPNAYNTVNGRRCMKLNRNVEYSKAPMCGAGKGEKDENI